MGVLSVVPVRTVQDATALEYYILTITSGIDQTVEVYVAGTLVYSAPFTANEPQRVEFEDPVKTEGERNLRVVGTTAGEWRGRVAWTGTKYAIRFVDEEGKELATYAVYLNLDNPLLINTKRAKETIQTTYTLAGRWVLEVMLREPEGFRYDLIDLGKITEDTTITLPLLKEAYVQMSMDLGVVWPWVVRAAGVIDYVVGTVAEALGFKDYPSFAAWIINYLCQNFKYPPHSWELKDNILYINYRITRDMVALAPVVAGYIIIAALIAGIIGYLIIAELAIISKAEADKARAEAQKIIAEEHTKAVEAWLKYAKEMGLTPQETQRGLEALGSSYTQMSQNLEPKPIPWTTYALIGGIVLFVIILLIVVTRVVR